MRESGKYARLKQLVNFPALHISLAKIFLKELNVPIGLIQTTWGGTPAEAWMSEEILVSDEDFIPILNCWDKKMKEYPALLEEFTRNETKLINEWKIDSANAANKGMAPPRRPSKPDGPGTRNQPAGLFNGMIFLCPHSHFKVLYGIKVRQMQAGHISIENFFQL